MTKQKNTLLFVLSIATFLLVTNAFVAAAPQNLFESAWVSQDQGTVNIDGVMAHLVHPGETIELSAQFRNMGSLPWTNDLTDPQYVGFYVYKDSIYSTPTEYNDPQSALFGKSAFASDKWGVSFDKKTEKARAALVDKVVQPGEIGTFKFSITVPADLPANSATDIATTAYDDRYYREDLTLAHGPNWMPNTTNGDPIKRSHVWWPIRVETQIPKSPFVSRKDTTLYLEGMPFTFAGANISWLGLDEDGTTFPSQYRIDDALLTAKETGSNTVRTLGVLSVGCPLCIQPRQGIFNKDALNSFDYAVKVAKENNLKLILPLVDNNDNFPSGGRKTYTNWRNLANREDFYTNADVLQDFEKHIAFVLNHVNSLTGVAYKDDPTIMAWALGNELSYESPDHYLAWAKEVSAYIKSVAPQQLVADGASVMAFNPQILAVPDVDLYGQHAYPLNISQLQAQSTLVKQAAKVLYVEDFDATDSALPEGTLDMETALKVDGARSARVTVTKTSPYASFLQLQQKHLSIEKGFEYVIQFYARANPPRKVEIALTRGDDQTVSLFQRPMVVELTDKWELFPITFDATTTEHDAMLAFRLADATGQVWLDTTSFYRASGSELLTNSSFEQRTPDWISPWELYRPNQVESTLDSFLKATEQPDNLVAGTVLGNLSGHSDTYGFQQSRSPFAFYFPGKDPQMTAVGNKLLTHNNRMRKVTAQQQPPLNAPVLHEVVHGSKGPLLTWRGVVGANWYSIQRSTDNEKWETVTDTATDMSAPFADAGATEGISYYYRIQAKSSAGIGSAFSNIQQLQSNLIRNASFEYDAYGNALAFYKLVKNPAVEGTVQQDVSSYHTGTTSLRFDITKAAANWWYLRLEQTPLWLKQDTSYSLSFWAKASKPRSLTVGLQKNQDPYTGYVTRDFTLTTDWKRYDTTFMSTVDDDNAMIVFDAAAATGQVWMDDVAVCAGGCVGN
ncbi:MAG: carbohydrate binding domain-containing protein [bacterium]